jgi:hypothetical protein
MKRTASGESGSKSKGSSTTKSASRRPAREASRVAAALCLRNGGNGDLEPGKLYRMLPDRKAAADGLLRVVDESGEDYLYPADFFAIVHVPAAAAKSLALVA